MKPRTANKIANAMLDLPTAIWRATRSPHGPIMPQDRNFPTRKAAEAAKKLIRGIWGQRGNEHEVSA